MFLSLTMAFFCLFLLRFSTEKAIMKKKSRNQSESQFLVHSKLNTLNFLLVINFGKTLLMLLGLNFGRGFGVRVR